MKTTRERHGHRKGKTPEYSVWMSMRNRCNNPNNRGYYKYGARGIRVCERWDLFSNFLADMGSRPSPRHSIERKNNDADYSPENCIWALPKCQARNTRRNHLLTHNGETKTLAEWSEITGLKIHTIRRRVMVSGWSVKDALETPVIGYRRGGLSGIA